MLNKIWNSPTITTWLSYSTRALALFGILPLVLKQFSEVDVLLWSLFSTILTLQNLADFGFRQTFSRLISYAYKGAKDIILINGKQSTNNDDQPENPNLALLNRIISTMRRIYIPLTIAVFLIMGTIGTAFMYKPILDSSNFTESWISWIVIVVISTVAFYGKLYMNFLEGLFKIALVRRVETVTSLASILSSIVILIFFPTLLNLILVNQFWFLIATIRDIYLCRKVEDGLYLKVSKPLPYEKKLFIQIWHPAWRSGVSGLMSIGLTNLTGLIYAQVGDTAAVASYLLALRIITQIRDVAMAPFYSKIPLLAMLRVKNETVTLLKTVKRGMLLSHVVFVLGVITVGIFSEQFLTLIHSDVKFVTPQLWAVLSLAFFIHRFGAMHIQVYISTNHVISHIADGISGIIYIVASLALINLLGIYAIPVAMLIGYLGFYAWYAASHSYRSLQVGFWNFEKTTALFPFIFISLYLIFTFLFT